MHAAKRESALQAKSSEQAKITSVDSGNTYINKEGWLLPDLSRFDVTGSANLEAKSNDGRSVVIKYTEYGYLHSSEVVTEEPFKSISSIGKLSSLGPISIYGVRVYEKNNRRFGYRLQVVRVFLDENKKVVERGGALFFFTYYDKDGDGIFEAVTLDETDKGITSFQDPPTLPDWILLKS